MAFREIRDVPCPVCGAGVGKPCLLRSGQPLELIHCTDRISAAAGVEPMTAPSVPYVPGPAAPVPEPPRPGSPRHEESSPAQAGSSNTRDESPGNDPSPARRGRGSGSGAGDDQQDAAPEPQPVLF